MFRKFKIAAFAASIVAFLNGVALAGNVPESSDPIKVIKNDWTGQLFSTEVVGELLRKWDITSNMLALAHCRSIQESPKVIFIFRLKFGLTTLVIYIPTLLIKEIL